MTNLSITSTKWPSIKSRLERDPDLINDMQITCLRCYRTISLDPRDQSATKCPGLVIFPCGCVTGETCARKFMAELFWRAPGKECPLCGTVVGHRHPSCRHQAILFPFRGLQDIEKVPKTLAEGGRIASVCLICRLHMYLVELGREFQKYMPAELRRRIRNLLIFPLITDWDLTYNINMDCDMLDIDEDETHEEPHFNNVYVSGPVEVLTGDNRQVDDDGTPDYLFDCHFLKILRRRLQYLYEASEGRWTPKIIDVRVGVQLDDDNERIRETIRDCFATLHERSPLYSEYINQVERDLRRSFDDVRGQWVYRQETRPRSDDSNSDHNAQVNDRLIEAITDQVDDTDSSIGGMG